MDMRELNIGKGEKMSSKALMPKLPSGQYDLVKSRRSYAYSYLEYSGSKTI